MDNANHYENELLIPAIAIPLPRVMLAGELLRARRDWWRKRRLRWTQTLPKLERA